ncbi:DUF4926 domain-containing protein [Rahnella sp. C60]|uniref:DUF4926 domain-containing protein n=1 Tax=Rahnella perminowiae TaxID=2816244 RepID=A0ABS6L4G1_9GAMM|nr:MULTISPECIES: DUF4926 domain-containing protein [Rahnella]UJD92020.1 DUF4926 domain-containing protein [Rahnella aquatilis]MBU9808718.1 DUF4926 domain-containing protein [Rahnella perminowiae]MBU9815374.1 DUF4926 domain-containing protein [Rahnella perminowiae]MBU9825160.1 DUF4926 domain-containing protein [Rahnella perminowiae]MBU9836742.1 DUF4926 domain-containing protein [Rahnella perminowiae]
MEFSLFDVVILNVDLPDEGLVKGMTGAIIDVYSSPSMAYEVEFCDQQGRTIASVALAPEQLQHKS